MRRARRLDARRPADGRLLGFMESLKLGGSANVDGFTYTQYTLGGTPITNARAYVGTVSLSAVF